MRQAVRCPSCGKPVDPSQRRCAQCGVDLAVAAALAESQVRPATGSLEGLPLSPEILVPRLGEYLMGKGLLTQSDLNQALVYQRQQAAARGPILLGQALRELSLVDADALDAAITEQILRLHAALQQANHTLEQRVHERTQELELALDKLQELSRLKANFIANISHELRTPLTHLKGYLQLLVDQTIGHLNPEQVEAMQVMLRAEERLERLIEDLITFSLASRGDLDLHLAPVDLALLARQALKEYRPKAAQARVKLSSLIPDGLPLVYCDHDKIHWVIAQLLDNAIKFTPQGGRVQVEVARSNGLINVAVMDTGIGIAPEQLGELFEPFHQLDGSATRRYNGTGLGLALTRRILRAHQSEVKVTSIEGRGSRFEFALEISG